MAEIALHNICKSYQEDQYVVRNFNLEIKDKQFVVFVGPSGCGKSTVLRMIAGLEEITTGELWMNGNLMNYTKPKERNVSMVFQNYALYPNMTVFENMAFSLEIRKVNKKEIKRKVIETAKLLQIESLLDQKPSALSGGQKQRVAIGSAILREPDVFLMDEPLSNLDAKLRTQMRTEIAKLYQHLNSSVIYVTHDQTEAMTLGTKIVVLKDGKIQQADTPENIYNYPVNLFVAGFIGSPSMNLIPAQLTLIYERIYLVAGYVEIALLEEQAEFLKQRSYWGEMVMLGIRPEDICIASERSISKLYSVPISCRVMQIETLGAEKLIYIMFAGKRFCLSTKTEQLIRVGEVIEVCIDLQKIHLFDLKNKRNIWLEEEYEME